MSQRLLHPMLNLATVSVCFFALVGRVPAQSVAGTATLDTGVVLTKLSPPVYPPLARQARIMGDVKIQVGIRQDGSVASAEVISGHPMLKQAALDSVQKSKFECRECSEAPTSYVLTYAFQIRTDGNCCSGYDRAPKVNQSGNRIEVAAPELCICDPAAVRTRVRSAKCLYLWKCGSHDVAVE